MISVLLYLHSTEKSIQLYELCWFIYYRNQLSMNDIETTQAPVTPEAQKPAEVPHDDTTLMSILAYIGILVLIPYFTAKQNPVVKFHVRQGLVLLVPEVLLWVASEILWSSIFSPIFMVLNLGLLVLSIIGIVNVVNKKQEPLPLVGQYAKHFNI